VTGILARSADRLQGLDESASSRRTRLLAECPTTAALASRFDYLFVITDAIATMDARLAQCVESDNGRLVISCPPQEGKSTLLRWFCVRLLIRHPEWRIGYVSYAANLARASGRFCRNMINTHSHEMGLAVSRATSDAGDWTLEGHRGGMIAVGIGGALTGKPIDFLVVDDPLSGEKDANSIKVLEAQEGWWHSVARTRFGPKASGVVTQTRWAEADLAGNRLAEGWALCNIPALADGETPDALERERGIYLTSTRDRTPADWEGTRHEVGERVWAALYQGRPAPLEGGVFKREWIERNRLDEAPPLVKIITMVDPADNEGGGDEAGVITGGVGADGRYYILADDSQPMTVARWFRVAFLAALRWGSVEVCYEKSLSGLRRKGREAWRDIRADALALHRAAIGTAVEHPADDEDEVDAVARVTALLGVLSSSSAGLAREDADAAELDEIEARLTELWPFVAAVLRLPETGIPVRAVGLEGGKLYRAKLVQPLYERDKVSHVGRYPLLEHTLTTWQEGQPSPDRMDADVHLLLQLSQHATATRVTRPVGQIPTRSTAGFGRGTLPRSTRTGWSGR
jgi:hypothetical protein